MSAPPITQGIETRYLGPTNSRPGRIKATAWGGNITVQYDHALSIEGNHRAAAMALAAKLGWRDTAPAEAWATGGNARGDGYNHVNTHRNLWEK
jgi:hypothetical protein